MPGDDEQQTRHVRHLLLGAHDEMVPFGEPGALINSANVTAVDLALGINPGTGCSSAYASANQIIVVAQS